MPLKNFNPTTPSRRSLVLVDRAEVYKGKPQKKLTKGLTKSGGRNNRGRITVWWRGGGHKRSYRIIDFKRQKDGIEAKVIRIEYDPNRSCFIALIKYEDGELWNGKDGTDEIHKIYKHIGWDPEKRRFKEGAETKNIEWTRIHNLPDHVYFNHSQHVNAGNIECQTCHGPVEEMDVLKQHAPLSMGWCINCHRETEVQFDNEYYEHYEQFHNEISNGERSKVTVEHIGGTECQKCHY